MFEQSVLDDSRRGRSKWSWIGLVAQLGLVSTMLLVPMISPEILSVVIPKTVLHVPLKPVAPVEVEVQKRSGPTRSQNTMAVAPRAYPPFAAPSVIQPLGPSIYHDAFDPPAFTLGSGSVKAYGDSFGPVGNSLPTAPPPAKPEPKREPAKPIRVGGQVQMANILNRVNPPYPELAKRARISGSVKLEGIIAKDGTVQQLKVISGHPLLVPAALEAVRQWRYRPTLLNGEPVEVITPIDVNFILGN